MITCEIQNLPIVQPRTGCQATHCVLILAIFDHIEWLIGMIVSANSENEST